MPYSFYWVSTNQLAMRVAYVAGQDYEEYIGEAFPKNQHRTGELVWRIKKISYDVNWRIISILWAERSKDFIFSWDLRATYTYG